MADLFVLLWPLVIGFCGFLVCIYLRNSRKKTAKIPGPDIVNKEEGNLPDMRNMETFYDYMSKLHDEFGSIVSFYMGKQQVVSIASPDLFQEHSKLFDRPVIIFKPLEDLITASSIQVTNGSEGKRRHALYSRYFSGAGKFYPELVTCVTEMLEKMAALSQRHQSVPLTKTMFELTTAVMSHCAFGDCFTREELKELVNLYHTWSVETEKKFNGQEVDKNESDHISYNEKMKAIVEKVLAQRRAQEDAKLSPKSYIDLLLNDSQLTEEAKFADAMTILIGGFHTTAYLLVWTIYFLARNKGIQDKLADEITTNLPNLEDFDAEDADRLPYLRQVISETLRIRGIGVFSARVADEPMMLGGLPLPATVPVIQLLPYVANSDKYFPDPTRFDPDRFSPAEIECRHPFAFRPFGFAGNRVCPGNKFALQEATVTLALFVARFQFDVVGDFDDNPFPGFVARPRADIWLTVRARN